MLSQIFQQSLQIRQISPLFERGVAKYIRKIKLDAKLFF